MQAQCGFEGVTLELVGVSCQQFLKNAELEGQERGPKQVRIEFKQLFKHGLDGARATRFPGLIVCLRGRSGLERCFWCGIGHGIKRWVNP